MDDNKKLTFQEKDVHLKNKNTKKGSKKIPLVTIVTSVFNGGHLLENTIKSIISQTYSNIEYIIIDGGSKDQTIDIIKKYDANIDYWISEPDDGIYFAWNKALQRATGDWIAFIGADDIYKHDAIEKMMSVALLNRELDYISARIELIRDGKVLRVVGKPWSWNLFKRYMCTGHNGSLHSRSLYERYGSYDTSYRSSADYEFLLRAGSSLKAGFVDSITVSMTLGGISTSSYKPIWETFDVIRKYRYISPVRAYWGVVRSVVGWTIKSFFKLI